MLSRAKITVGVGIRCGLSNYNDNPTFELILMMSLTDEWCCVLVTTALLGVTDVACCHSIIYCSPPGSFDLLWPAYCMSWCRSYPRVHVGQWTLQESRAAARKPRDARRSYSLRFKVRQRRPLQVQVYPSFGKARLQSSKHRVRLKADLWYDIYAVIYGPSSLSTDLLRT